MPIIEPAIRPPSEADSFLLQVTLGCSSNQCGFCGAYLNKPFKIKDTVEIFSDIEKAAKRYPDTRRVFLMDGDALVLNNSLLLPILEKLRTAFPGLARVSAYANGYNISSRRDSELRELYRNKLSLIYMGLESGSETVLRRCNKRSSAGEMVTAVRRCQEAGIKSSVIVLLGLGGKEYSREHVRGTIEAVNIMQPRYLSFLSLMLVPGTFLAEEAANGAFVELDQMTLLKEAQDIIAGLKLDKTIFRCDHASNYLPLEGRLPQDKEKLLTTINMALSGDLRLRPEYLRGL
jgi:radical SAM superfamily enzyme YgiQ (UPF0313 family)